VHACNDQELGLSLTSGREPDVAFRSSEAGSAAWVFGVDGVYGPRTAGQARRQELTPADDCAVIASAPPIAGADLSWFTVGRCDRVRQLPARTGTVCSRGKALTGRFRALRAVNLTPPPDARRTGVQSAWKQAFEHAPDAGCSRIV